ncbi:MAG: hypothetical protein ACREUU_03240, partial [Gammaproteobacteria bacterium]
RMVDFSFNNSSNSTAGQCRFRNVSGPNRSLFGQVNSTFGDPLAWSGTNAPVPVANLRIPYLRLAIRPTVPLAPLLSGSFVNGAWSGEMLVQGAASSVVLRADDQRGHVSVSEPFAILIPDDTYADGLPDPWEQRYFSSITATNGGPDDDADGDGASNRDELATGTDPADETSHLRVTAELSGNTLRLRLVTRAGRTYRIERADTLGATNVWSSVPGAEALAGAGGSVPVTDSIAAQVQQRFYRARLLP